MALGGNPRFGTVLKQYRLGAGLTHEALAERAGVSARAISDLERGVTRLPRRETLLLLAEALGLTPDQRGVLEAAGRLHIPGDVPADVRHPPHNLPPQLTSFIGRDSERQFLGELLRRRDQRLVTLTGPGGTGKTRLALRVAADLVTEFPDGICFVGLGPVADADGMIRAVAQAVDVHEAAAHSPESLVTDALRHRRLLLLLDNFEHLLSGLPFLSRLIRNCPRLTVLVTSRAALRLSGEQEVPVAPLPIPDLACLPPTDALTRYPAVALFTERAALVRPDFQLSSSNAAVVAAICVRLDGLPLAIELAAARIKLLPPRALLARLGDPSGSSLHILTAGATDLPPRQRTLRDTIAWSYDLLTPDEQRLFRRLAVFIGGCDLDAIKAICWPPSKQSDAPDASMLDIGVIDGMASLVDKSLVHQSEGPDGEARLGMLETIREFALEQLAASGEAAVIRARHARYFLDLVERSGAVLLGAEGRPARLAVERDNIRTALRWLVESG